MDSNTRKRRYYGLGWGGKTTKRCEIYTPVVLPGKNYDWRREERKQEQKVLDLKRKELDVSRKELEAKRRELELKKIELDVKQKELDWKQTEQDFKQKELEFEQQKEEEDEMDNDGLRPPRLQRAGGALNAAANFSGDHLPDRAVSYSPQAANPGLVNKVDKVRGPSEISTSQLAQAQRDQSSSSSGIQTGYVGLQSENRCPKATKYMQVLSFGIHNDIAKNIINVLKPSILEHPSQTPSTDYMSKILSCQACGLAIDNVENLLVCDACERGTHLVCLSLFNREEIPEVEWHCCVCLISKNGKLFPPKYGRVMRNKVSANTGVGSLEKVGNQWKVTNTNIAANGNPGSVYAVKFDITGNNLIDPTSGLNHSDVREMQETKISESKTKMDKNHIYESKLLPKDTEVLLPEVVGQPCTPESNEVYEASHDGTATADLIQGSCDVLPPET